MLYSGPLHKVLTLCVQTGNRLLIILIQLFLLLCLFKLGFEGFISECVNKAFVFGRGDTKFESCGFESFAVLEI